MIIFLRVVHVIVALFLILVVLLQTGKGAEMGAAFGGSSQTLFGGSGPTSFMAKLTTAAAICFMLTSLGLASVSSQRRVAVGDMPVAPTSDQAPMEIPEETQDSGSMPVSPQPAGEGQNQ